MSETWRAVVGWEGLYSVSDMGRVRSEARTVWVNRGAGHPSQRGARILKPAISRGYQRVVLQLDGQTQNVAVHRLVLSTFVGPCPPGMEACHANDVRDDNRLSNLRWDTKAANCADRTRNGGSPNARKTHRPKGHPYSPENTYQDGGSRKCRTCRIRQAVALKQRKRQARKEAA